MGPTMRIEWSWRGTWNSFERHSPPSIPWSSNQGSLQLQSRRPKHTTNVRRTSAKHIPFALSSEYSCATLSNRCPSYASIRTRHIHHRARAAQRTWIFCNASVAFECFSHKMCRTFTAVAAFNAPLL